MEHSAALHAIQFAVAPVFLLTAVASLIGALATRLARIIDRARDIEERLLAGSTISEEAAREELRRARVRAWIVNGSLALLTISAALIGATVMTLFIGGTGSASSETLIPWTFLGGLVSFILALLCFLIETLLATHLLNFGKR
ncbi:MAG: hypothetical protein JWM26_4429 [Betaproteobacteria bacterium]|jgi:hypothetical protein|nr:hypothetical protein [Betaproteobacteria bacterium]